MRICIQKEQVIGRIQNDSKVAWGMCCTEESVCLGKKTLVKRALPITFNVGTFHRTCPIVALSMLSASAVANNMDVAEGMIVVRKREKIN